MRKHVITLPPPDKAPVHTGNILVWMWYFMLPYKSMVMGYFAFRTVRYTILSLLPIIIGFVIDGLESGDAVENTSRYMWIIGGFMTLFCLCLINTIFIPEVRVFEKAARGLTLYSINHLNSLSLNWHEKQGSGGKLQRVMTGRKGFQEFTRHVRWDVFPLVGNMLAIGITVAITDMPLIYMLLYTLFIVTYLWSSWFFAQGYFQLYGIFNQKFENLLSGVYEFVSAIRTVKAFHLPGYINKKAVGLEESGQEAIMDAFSLNLMRWTICNLIAGFWLFLFVGLGFYWAIHQEISAGVYAATLFLAFNIWLSCETIGAILEKFYEYGNGIHRLVETLRIKPKILDLQPEQKFPDDWKQITLDKMSYAYDENESQGVQDISFTAKRGQKIAFVGNSGAGKSTLVKLLMKQMLPDSGNFSVDGTAISHVSTPIWLQQIGFVPQDVELFNLTLRENILIDRDDIEPEILDTVLEQSALKELIDSLPEGLDTVIGERGIKLSGGQRQRLGIARALIRQAPIMIFDEATSSLDSISEHKIQSAIENSFKGRTVFVIAHRLSTIRNVDRIIVLDEGCIIESGSFDELLSQNGHFAKLWAIQTKKSEDIQEEL